MRNISILVAYSKNRVIGFGGKIPWNLPSERNRFKQICSGKKIIMGRKSFEEIGHALSYCTIIIISKTMKKSPKDCILVDNLQKALKITQNSDKEILIAGGQSIYEQILPFVNKIYATEIHNDFEGDTFFPELNENFVKKIDSTHEENGISYDYVTFIKKKS